MSASQGFNDLLADVAAALAPRGFARTGTTLQARQDDNWKIVNFQKSRKSASDQAIFTVNLGVVSGRLRAFFRGHEARVRPSADDCHWRVRLGAVPAEGGDRWWTIDSTHSARAVRDEILRELIDVALPKLEQLAHDEALRDLWLRGRSPSLTDLQRLQNLAVLVAALGPRDHLGGVIAELRLRAPGPARFIEQKLNQTNATEA